LKEQSSSSPAHVSAKKRLKSDLSIARNIKIHYYKEKD